MTNEEDVARVGAVESSAERAEREADELLWPCDKEYKDRAPMSHWKE